MKRKHATTDKSMTAPARFLKWDDETNSADFVISTEEVDRDGDTLDMDGVDLEEYRVNPMVLLNHDDDEMSIGVSQDPASGELMIRKMEVDGKPALVSRVYFNMEDPRAKNVALAVKNGFMRAASVSFDPIEGGTEKNRYGGNHYRRWKMIEWSIVTIPANASAVRRLRSLCKRADEMLTVCKSWASRYKLKAWDDEFDPVGAVEAGGGTSTGGVSKRMRKFTKTGSAGKERYVKLKLWKNKSNPKKGWVLKADLPQGEVDEEMAEYLENQGVDEVQPEDAPPPDDGQWEEVPPEATSPDEDKSKAQKQFSRIEQIGGNYVLIGVDGKLGPSFPTREQAVAEWDRHDLSGGSGGVSKAFSQEFLVSTANLERLKDDVEGSGNELDYVGRQGDEHRVRISGDTLASKLGPWMRQYALKPAKSLSKVAKDDSEEQMAEAVAEDPAYDEKMSDGQLDDLMEEKGVPQAKRWAVSRLVKNYAEKIGFKALDKLITSLKSEMKGVEQPDVMGAGEKALKILEAAKAKAYPEAGAVAEKAEELMEGAEEKASGAAKSKLQQLFPDYSSLSSKLQNIVADDFEEMAKSEFAGDLDKAGNEYRNRIRPASMQSYAAAIAVGKSKAMDEDAAVEEAMDQEEVPAEKRWHVKRLAKALLAEKRYDKSVSKALSPGDRVQDVSEENPEEQGAVGTVIRMEPDGRVRVRWQSGKEQSIWPENLHSKSYQKRLSKADEEAIDAATDDLDSMAQGQDLPKHLKGTVKGIVDKLRSLKRKDLDPTTVPGDAEMVDPDTEAEMKALAEELSKSRTKRREEHYRLTGERLN